jgi:AbrB family looped-hinge helix DNA binding protein
MSYLEDPVMVTTKLSSKGQVIIPKPIRSSHHWDPGQELVVIDIGDGIILKPVPPFKGSSLEKVAGCLRYEGKPKSLKEIEAAIRKGVEEQSK